MKGKSLAGFQLLILLLLVPAIAEATEVVREFNGLRVNANLEMAEGKNFADGIILITHSLIQHNRREPIPYVQKLLKERGYSSLAINYSLQIDNRHGPHDCMFSHRYTIDQSLEEIASWVNWLKQKGTTKLVLFGHSYGGNEIARYAASNDEDAVKGVILLGPGTADHRMWSSGGYKIRYGKDLNSVLKQAEILVAAGEGEQLMKNVDFLFCPQATVSAKTFVSYYRVDPERLLPNLIKSSIKPMLFIAASEDNRMPDLNRLVKPFMDGRKTRLIVIKGAGHFFLDLHSDDAVDEAVSFIKQLDY